MLLLLFATLGDLLEHLRQEIRYVLDSFPVVVFRKIRRKHLSRILRSKLLAGKVYHGRCASKRVGFTACECRL